MVVGGGASTDNALTVADVSAVAAADNAPAAAARLRPAGAFGIVQPLRQFHLRQMIGPLIDRVPLAFQRLGDALLVAVNVLFCDYVAVVADLRREVRNVYRDVMVERHAELFGLAVEQLVDLLGAPALVDAEQRFGKP